MKQTEFNQLLREQKQMVGAKTTIGGKTLDLGSLKPKVAPELPKKVVAGREARPMALLPAVKAALAGIQADGKYPVLVYDVVFTDEQFDEVSYELRRAATSVNMSVTIRRDPATNFMHWTLGPKRERTAEQKEAARIKRETKAAQAA